MEICKLVGVMRIHKKRDFFKSQLYWRLDFEQYADYMSTEGSKNLSFRLYLESGVGKICLNFQMKHWIRAYRGISIVPRPGLVYEDNSKKPKVSLAIITVKPF